MTGLHIHLVLKTVRYIHQGLKRGHDTHLQQERRPDLLKELKSSSQGIHHLRGQKDPKAGLLNAAVIRAEAGKVIHLHHVVTVHRAEVLLLHHAARALLQVPPEVVLPQAALVQEAGGN